MGSNFEENRTVPASPESETARDRPKLKTVGAPTCRHPLRREHEERRSENFGPISSYGAAVSHPNPGLGVST